MSTTSLFVEILIIGIEALVWLGLFLSLVWNPGPYLDIFKHYKDYAALFTTLLLALAYVIGIIIDRLADSFYKILRYHSDAPLPAPVGKMRLLIMHGSEGMAKFLDYQRSRLRIARATVFNLLLTLIVIVIWLIHYNVSDAFVFALVIGVGLAAFVLSISAARWIEKAQLERLVEAYSIITESKENNNMSQRVVAAVCYQRRNNGIEFLLVRTKGGKYWTFPKGHIKKQIDELPWHAGPTSGYALDFRSEPAGQRGQTARTAGLHEEGSAGHLLAEVLRHGAATVEAAETIEQLRAELELARAQAAERCDRRAASDL